jgi:photosystem II stability/assembly factor-like uncharacterized protein
MPHSRIAFLLLCLSAPGASQPFAPSLYNGLQWRLIGPFRGGRVLAVTGVPGNPATFYMGSVGGGIFKTTDAGTVWKPIFDGQNIASIGAIEVAPSNPDIVYAGTGEADMRSDISFGNGIYKSTDAGKTWTNIGLRDSRQIGRILVDPRDPNLVYVAALGHAYGPNTERGVFRSRDGGATWSKVLDKGPDVGAIDLGFEPENPKIIYAATWNARRPPWSQYPPNGGPGSGLYKSADGGTTWQPIAGHGLPEGEWGRVGIAVARGGRVYVAIDAKPAGLYRSDDHGRTWALVGTDPRVESRAWYFSGVTVDPHRADTVYLPNVGLYRSNDAGKTFEVVRGAPGGDDYHTLWIDPIDSARMILGTDQGATVSVDGAKTWTTWYNQPSAQFYHVATDNQFPYWVYGSQQDSGTAAVPSRTNHGLISERDWISVGAAESGYIAPDPKDSNIVYVNNTGGSLTRFDKRTSQGQNITPWPLASFGAEISQRKYRNTWTSPLVFSPADPTALYFGTQYLLKTIDGGLHWREISPDLTGASKTKSSDSPTTTENAKERGYGVIYTIAPSPLNATLIWTGSDTGAIYVTRDAGKTWSNVTPQGLPDWSKITQIEASHFNPAVAYAAVDRHRREDYAPHLYRTRDYGKTWTELTAGISEPAFFNSVKEDPVRKGLLFAACETGVYVSFDDAEHWQSLQLNLPVTSVRDLVIHGNDLAIATHGRSFWILDDISPLRQIDAKVAASEEFFFKPAKAMRISSEGFQGTPLPVEEPKAANPPDGAVLDYYLKSAPAAEVTLDILDRNRKTIRHYSSREQPSLHAGRGQGIADIWLTPPAPLPANAGMNRFVWDLRYADPPGDGVHGPMVAPGVYQAKFTAAGISYTQPIAVALDPRSRATPLDLTKQLELSLQACDAMRSREEFVTAVTGMKTRLAVLRTKTDDKAITSSADALDAELDRLLSEARPLGREFSAVLDVTGSADRVPPAPAYTIYEQATRKLNALASRWQKLQGAQIAALDEQLRAVNIPALVR